jgi:hypothetical protein
MTTGEWIVANTSYKGRPFSFDGYGFQRQIADDLHDNLDVMKISQVGLSEIQTRKALAFCVRNPGVTGILSLPNKDMYTRFSQTRIAPMVNENKVFNSDADSKSVRSMGLMQFGRSFLNIMNATEGSATSISADFVFNDEVDLSDQKMIALFASRLQNSIYRIKQRFSTPTWTGYGIDGTYGSSDMQEYHCKCSACRSWELPLFNKDYVHIPGLPDSVALSDITTEMLPKLDLDNAVIACTRCGSPLDLDTRHREWVATYPQRTHARGYRVRPFSSGRISVPYIVTQLDSYRKKDFIRGWYNTVLGEPHTETNARLDEGQIRTIMKTPGDQEISSDAPVFLGIDIGAVCHLVMATPISATETHVFSFEAILERDLMGRVKEIMARHNLVSAACDRHPYTPSAEALRDLTEGRLMPVEYRGDADLKPVKDASDTITHWQAKRTKLIDNVVKNIRQQNYIFTGYGLHAATVIAHLRDMVREETPEQVARWVKLTGNDHFFHALAFLDAAIGIPGVTSALSTVDHRSVLIYSNLAVGTGSSLLQSKTPQVIRSRLL